MTFSLSVGVPFFLCWIASLNLSQSADFNPPPHPIFNSTQTDGSHAISTISKGIRKHIAMSIQCPRIITPHMEDELFVFGKEGNPLT